MKNIHSYGWLLLILFAISLVFMSDSKNFKKESVHLYCAHCKGEDIESWEDFLVWQIWERKMGTRGHFQNFLLRLLKHIL